MHSDDRLSVEVNLWNDPQSQEALSTALSTVKSSSTKRSMLQTQGQRLCHSQTYWLLSPSYLQGCLVRIQVRFQLSQLHVEHIENEAIQRRPQAVAESSYASDEPLGNA